MISAIMFNVILALPLSHNGLLIELASSKEAIFLSARRNGRAYSCLSARGGGLPWFNYEKITDDIDLIFFETPTNPFLNTITINEIRERIHNNKTLIAVDNTWATPFINILWNAGQIYLYIAQQSLCQDIVMSWVVSF
jgi:alanine-alpha-ketoisovalerate/valine-pyruvate aminotransferase